MQNEVRELCVKLLEALHLNVPERRRLPSRGAPFSEMVTAVEEKLVRMSGFRFDWLPE